MKKNQLFYILKISSERLRNSNYNLDLSFKQAIINQEMITISTSELTRTIHRLTNKNFSQGHLNELLIERKIISKKKNSNQNRRLLEDINNQINELLFIPEIITVSFTDKRHATKLLDAGGFVVNGKNFIPFMSSSGMIRRNTMLFIDSNISNEIEVVFNNGRNKSAKVVPVKFGVYYSLYSSSSINVSFPRIAVVPDKLITLQKEVDFTTFEGNVDPVIKPEKRNLEFNSFDGQGLVSPKMAKIWSQDLELDYIPSSFIVRSSFLKGLCVTFDFHKFAKEKGKSEFLDVYGNVVNVKDVDALISESQFKMWSSYSSTQNYIENCEKNFIGWGITRVSPKQDKKYAFSSYQFIQSLKLDDSQIEEICKPTVNWLSNVSGMNYESVITYLLGDIEYKGKWFDNLDYNIQALLLESSLIKDSYLINYLDKSLSKKKKDSCMGRLVFPANYQFMISDCYAQCSHIFKIEGGLLREGYCYSEYWNNEKADNIALVRSPIVHSSEVNKLKLEKSNESKEWFKYITSGIVFPPYGDSLDMAILGGADNDGDIVFSTNYKSFVDGKIDGLPIFYETISPDKEVVEDRIKVLKEQAKGFGTKVGFFTNTGSTMISMLSDFDENSLEYKILNSRYKCIRVFQGYEIDKMKGLIVPDFPAWWTKITRSMSDFEKSITVTKRPYFFKYLYDYMAKKYTEERSSYNNISKTIYNLTLDELENLKNKTKDQQSLIDQYLKDSSFIDNDSVMNRVSHYMENVIKEIGKKKHVTSKNFDFKKILSVNNYKPTKNDVEKVVLLYKEYKTLKRALRESISESNDENYSSLDTIKKYVNKRGYSTISSNSEDLGNMIVYVCYNVLGETSKKFAWDCFGEEIVENIKKRKKEKFVRVPIKNKNGSFDYLYERYGIYMMNFSTEETNV